jgi:hypothetical protein
MQKRPVILALIGIIMLAMLLSGCNVNLPAEPGEAYTQLAQQVM